jgi:hypothetical protein
MRISKAFKHPRKASFIQVYQVVVPVVPVVAELIHHKLIHGKVPALWVRFAQLFAQTQ